MNKLKETLSSVWKAARYSFAFCLRNNKRDTIIVSVILLLQTLLGYWMILLTGELVSVVQARLISAKTSPISFSDFMRGKDYFPIMLFVVALFVEIILRKYRSYIGNRQRQILKAANTQETNALKASLDIGRKRSKQYDDVDKKIDELPNSWYTRISFAGETIEFCGDFITFVIFGVSLSFKHQGYMVILLVTSIPMVFAEFIAINRTWKKSQEMIPIHKKRGVLQQAFIGTTAFLQGVMFNQLPTLTTQIREKNDYVLETMDKLHRQNLKITLGAYVVAMFGLSVVLMHAVYNTISIGGDIGVLTVVVASSRRFQSSIRDIVIQIASQWQSVKGMIIIEEEYFAMKPLLTTPKPVIPSFQTTPAIRLENVSFSYPENEPVVLNKVSFTIKPGSKTVIIGKNGSGKSSLTSLLLRNYDPTSGDIWIGDVNLRNIEPKVWSEWVCALLQEFVILDRKVGDEIASARLDQPVNTDRIEEAAQFAGFDSIVDEDPNGYGAQIGTEFGGREFSGGEGQRLAVARAKYRNTPILILDEPDAKLDPIAAKHLFENVFALKDVTVVIVTQHISRATQGDNIVLLDHGDLVGAGTHAELLATNKRYAEMFYGDKERLGG